ncbi:hypothetical protein [Planococcus antarcticus]|nr:hypothetical protein [Planococcus antarcticus]
MNDLVGAIVDVLKLIGNFVLGTAIVSILLYGVAKLFDLIVYLFF